jgi:hypothetical protein
VDNFVENPVPKRANPRHCGAGLGLLKISADKTAGKSMTWMILTLT